MKRKNTGSTLFLSLSLLCVGLILFQPSVAKKKEHSMRGNSTLPEVCKNKNAIPTIQCASTTTASFDKKGVLWVVWYSTGHIYLSRSDDKGQTFGPAVTVNRTPERIYAKGENRPKVAFGKKGEIYISWTQKLTEKRFSGHIRFSRSLDAGKYFYDPITVNDHLAVTSHRFDALAVNKNGDIYIAWLDKRDLLAAKKINKKYNGAALYYAVSTNAGKSFRKNKKIADSSCECCRVVMAVDNRDLPVVVWRHIYGDNIRDHGIVNFSKTDQANKPKRLSYDNWHIEGCPHHGPAISIAEDGVYHITWFNNAPGSHGLFYANSHDNGISFSTPLNFGNYKNAAGHADILSLGKNVYIVWKEFDGKQSRVYLKKSVDTGASWSIAKKLAESSFSSEHPFLTHNGTKVYLSWHRTGEPYKLLFISK